MRKVVISICGFAVFAAIAFGVFQAADWGAKRVAASRIQSLSLARLDGREWRVGELGGRIGVIYFGYTYCPDVCPTALNTLSLTMEKLGSHAAVFQPMFVSVDPARDTPGTMRAYLKHFDDRILGLTGSESQLKSFTQAFGATYQLKKTRPGDNTYLVDHTAGFFLATESGEHAPLPITDDPEKMRDVLLRWRERLIGLTPPTG